MSRRVREEQGGNQPLRLLGQDRKKSCTCGVGWGGGILARRHVFIKARGEEKTQRKGRGKSFIPEGEGKS